MPPNKGQKPSPSVNQRRVFRGRGGPTDGNIPPKKSPRVRVKYQHNQTSSDVHQSQEEDDDADFLEEHINQLSLNDSELNNDRINGRNSGSGGEEEEDCNNPLSNEIHHLQKRIQNITFSIQSSPLGVSNPNTWRTNCLHPVKNVVKEWRSILSFYSREIMEESDEIVSNGVVLQRQLHDTATKVFILIQMVMQTGPLVGSNPGYFKRCGGEVASVAFEFLTHVIDISGVATTTTAADDNDVDENEDQTSDDNDDGVISESNDHDEFDFPDSDVNSDSGDSSSSSSIDDDEGEGGQDKTDTITPVGLSSLPARTQMKGTQVVQMLQSSFLFTEKQSQKIHQWHHDAQKAAEANKAPSKSASKLQGQKSKKQRMKDLKMERKLKKKNKGRGRK